MKGGLSHIQDEYDNPIQASIQTYFNVTAQKLFCIEGVHFKWHETKHVPGKSSFGFVFSDLSNGLYMYSSDSLLDATEEGILLKSKMKRIFHDCSFSPRYAGTVHAHLADFVDLPEAIRSKTYLMHYGNPDACPEDPHGMELVIPGISYPLFNLKQRKRLILTH